MVDEWLSKADYEPSDHLQMALNAVRLGVPAAVNNLRSVFNAALDAKIDEDLNGGALLGRALSVLHASNNSPSLDELERLIPSTTYNLASSAVSVIAQGGTAAEAETLMRLYENAEAMLRLVILDVLEPLAGRLGLRITRSQGKLRAAAI
jgi:hypothetical protein